MKLNSLFPAFVAAICLLTAQTFAQETATTAKQCDKECQTKCEGACPISKAMAQLPKMTFKVGDESLCCSEMAAAKAKETQTKVHYVVGKQTFEAQDKAFVSLVEQTEKFVNDFVTPCKCEKSGVTSIAGESCGCPVEAGKKAELVKSAANKVMMTFAVGEKTCHCPTEAANLAKTTGAKKEFVVAGEKTCCEMTARLNLAKAKYKAAVQALVASKTETSKEKSGS